MRGKKFKLRELTADENRELKLLWDKYAANPDPYVHSEGMRYYTGPCGQFLLSLAMKDLSEWKNDHIERSFTDWRKFIDPRVSFLEITDPLTSDFIKSDGKMKTFFGQPLLDFPVPIECEYGCIIETWIIKTMNYGSITVEEQLQEDPDFEFKLYYLVLVILIILGLYGYTNQTPWIANMTKKSKEIEREIGIELKQQPQMFMQFVYSLLEYQNIQRR